MTNKIILGLLVVACIAAIGSRFAAAPGIDDSLLACSADAMECPDGSFVGRTGSACEFVCPEPVSIPVIPADIQAGIDAKADLIVLSTPSPLSVITSPLVLSGEARGIWFFEGSFPVVLTDWNGLIIAEGFVTTNGEWMTEDFVPYTGTLEFESPYTADDPDFMKNGSLILQKDNPSGLSEFDDALELPVRFAL